jgi:hypothetical protein
LRLRRAITFASVDDSAARVSPTGAAATTSRTSAWNGDRFAGRRDHLGQRLRRTESRLWAIGRRHARMRLVEQPEITARISSNFDFAQSRWRMTFDMTLFIENTKSGDHELH